MEADIRGRLLTKLSQLSSTDIDVGQGQPDGFHELLIQRVQVGFSSPLLGIVNLPLDKSQHFCWEYMMVGMLVDLQTARCWLVHEPLLSLDSHCRKCKQVVYVPGCVPRRQAFETSPPNLQLE